MVNIEEIRGELTSDMEDFLDAICRVSHSMAGPEGEKEIRGVCLIEPEVLLVLLKWTDTSGLKGVSHFSQLYLYYKGYRAREKWLYYDKHHAERREERHKIVDLDDIELDEVKAGDCLKDWDLPEWVDKERVVAVRVSCTLVNPEGYSNLSHSFVIPPEDLLSG